MLEAKSIGILVVNMITVMIIFMIGSEVIQMNLIPFGPFIVYGLIALKLVFLLLETVENIAATNKAKGW